MEVKTIRAADWTETDSDDNAASTASHAAVAEATHYVTSISASFSGAGAAGVLLTLKSGTTELARWYVSTTFHIEFPNPIPMVRGELAELQLAASGTGGIVSGVNMQGYTL